MTSGVVRDLAQRLFEIGRQPAFLVPQHQVRKIEVPLVRRHIGAFGHVAEVAQVTVIDDLPVILFSDVIDFHRLGGIDQVEQGWEGLAQADTATTAVANVENTLHFLVERLLAVELRVLPVERMTRRGVEIAFACHVLFARSAQPNSFSAFW